MIDDCWVAMRHGPVNSGIYDMVNGMIGPDPDRDAFIAPRAGYDVPLARALTEADFDRLSFAEREVLAEIWADFGGMSQFELRDYTHRCCPEWESPAGGSQPIPYSRLFRFLGRENAHELAEAIDERRALNPTFKRNADGAQTSVPAG